LTSLVLDCFVTEMVPSHQKSSLLMHGCCVSRMTVNNQNCYLIALASSVDDHWNL